MGCGEKLEKLLSQRKKIKERLDRIEKIFQEEKENEEAWPGHESTFFQTADQDRLVLLEHLSLIEKALKGLGHKM